MAARDPRPRLHDILEAIAGVREAVGGMSLEAYAAGWTTRRAAERAVEIISEASRHIPESMKAREAGVPWRQIAAIGSLLRHGYGRVDDEVIHTIVTRQLAPLEEAIRRLLERLEGGGED
jgi:uncharacterized protein with HEPN domain